MLAFGMSGLLLAGEGAQQRVQQSGTQRVDFLAGGVLHVTRSPGELTIVGWDRPDVEIVTTKSTVFPYDSQDRQKAAHELDQVQVKVERHDNEVVINTSLPRRGSAPPASRLKGANAFYLDCHISVPRHARLVVEHGDGEVHIENLTGDISVSTHKGEITLRLPPESAYAIDAKTNIGDVISDFPGTAHRRPWLFAHRFVEEPSPAAHKLYLRVGFGDIIIQKISQPPTWSTPASPRPQSQ